MGTCPYCHKKFEISQYGHVLCSHCNGKLWVTPDEPDLWLHTPWGIFGISGDRVMELLKKEVTERLTTQLVEMKTMIGDGER